MPEDLTLDAFASETSGEDEETTEQTEEAEGSEQANQEGNNDGLREVGPVSPISIYDPDGVQCVGCSDIVERLFQTDGERRCRDCTAWESSPEADEA